MENSFTNKKVFAFYNDVNNKKIYIPRYIYEACRKNNFEFESTPKIIDNNNYYSIPINIIKELHEKANYIGIERKILLKKEKISTNPKDIIIAYKDDNTNNIYLPNKEIINTENKETKTILNKKCYKVTEKELENIYNKKFIIVNVYTKPLNNIEITLCNIDNSKYINESILKKYSISINNRKKIRVDGSIFIEILKEELDKIKDIGNNQNNNIIFTNKNIYPI